MSKFQIITTALFIIFIVAGLIAFATFRGKNSQNMLPAISIWGTLPSNLIDQYVNKINISRSEALKINYTEIKEADFDKTFVEALARGQGPDAILIPQDLIHRHEDKIIPIPYTVFSERDFRNTFIEQSELYLNKNGILALPFIVNPLVMYWNRDSFTNAGIATYPRYWDEFTALSTKLTVKDVNSNIRKSVIALGEFANINHAREILGTLFLQSGNPVTFKETSTDGNLSIVSSALGDRNYRGSVTSLPALNFFTKFSNPSNPDYSWNRSLPNSKSSFLSGNLATYFGFASEINDIRQKNPNMDFDISPLPQIRGGKYRSTYALMYGFSIVRSAVDTNSTYTIISTLLAPESLKDMIELSYLPPVRRDMIATGSTDPYLSIFFDSALISKSWLDTDKAESYMIFQDMVESVTSGKRIPSQAIQQGSDEFDISLKKI